RPPERGERSRPVASRIRKTWPCPVGNRLPVRIIPSYGPDAGSPRAGPGAASDRPSADLQHLVVLEVEDQRRHEVPRLLRVQIAPDRLASFGEAPVPVVWALARGQDHGDPLVALRPAALGSDQTVALAASRPGEDDLPPAAGEVGVDPDEPAEEE